jgi:tryptophan-rich sensory protein
MKKKKTTFSPLALLALTAATTVAAAFGAASTRRNLGLRYRLLRKPAFQPPNWLFAPVWTVLYGMMTASAYRVWQRGRGVKRTRALQLWSAQLAANGAWSYLFFARRQRKAAMVDLVGLWALIAAYATRARQIDRTAGWLMAPYLTWTTFAGVLNAELIRLND